MRRESHCSRKSASPARQAQPSAIRAATVTRVDSLDQATWLDPVGRGAANGDAPRVLHGNRACPLAHAGAAPVRARHVAGCRLSPADAWHGASL